MRTTRTVGGLLPLYWCFQTADRCIAENYFAADYPDEDLEWDDEYDRGAYQYRNQNASDMEEFDERDFDDAVDDFIDKA